MILNHTVEALMERRSIRSYRSEQVSEEELTDILKTGKYAPSAMDRQARHFTVIQNKALLADIRAAMQDATDDPFYGAPTVIVLSAPADARFAPEDTSCAIMNLMLAAHSYGLGTCFIGCVRDVLRTPAIQSRLKLPEGYIPYSCITLGYPKEHADAPAPRRTDDVSYVR